MTSAEPASRAASMHRPQAEAEAAAKQVARNQPKRHNDRAELAHS